jgi:hypothetical protein
MNNVLKKISLSIRVIAVFGSLLLMSDIANARDYPMVCKVGGTMRLILTPHLSSGDTRLELRFRKARQGFHFNRNNLAPGECAWMDRAINNREPSLMAWDLDARVWSSSSATGYGASYGGVVRDGGSSEGLADYFLQAIRGRVIEDRRVQRYEFFVVNVHNTGRGYFQISSIQAGI